MICNHSSLIAVTLAYRCRLKFQYYQMANHNFDLVKLQFVCTLLTDISHREEQRCLKLRSIISNAQLCGAGLYKKVTHCEN